MSENTKTAYVLFANHFDLVWRRAWEKSYEHDGLRWASYSDVESVILDTVLDMAERGRGAYQLEQTFTLRMYMRKHPEALPRLRRLQEKGLFEVLGGGEAIIDVNMCMFETMARNWASGARFCIDELGRRPFLASHCDGFGSSAQFPQVIRGCGYRGVENLSYAKPDNDYWRGLDGSTVFVRKPWPGQWHFYDHCYHEPCPACQGHGIETGCAACASTGFDIRQNFYPPYEALKAENFVDGISLFAVTSEEMIPPDYIQELISKWGEEQPEIRYVWGTQRHLAPLLDADLELVDAPPAERVSSKVENNPAQTGCMVTLSGSKLGARRSEAVFYGAETAIAALSFSSGISRGSLAQWHALFPELCLFHFHDAVTGTHQEIAARELRDRRRAFDSDVNSIGSAMFGDSSSPRISVAPVPDEKLRVFNPRGEATDALRIELPVADWHKAVPLVAETADGRRFPVTMPWHSFSTHAPVMKFPIIHAVGSSARTRPESTSVFIEVPGIEPLSWTSMTLRKAVEPKTIETREIANARIRIILGDKGVDEVCDLKTGVVMRGEDAFPIGALRLDEDEGDPWATRKIPAFKDSMAPYTRFIGAARFDGYSEAWYYGIYEPNLGFGREKDSMVFGLEWQITVRLLDGADRVDFGYEIFWKSANRRIRAVFPTQSPTDTGWYSIPGGWIERRRYEQTGTDLWSPNGDWPALYYVATMGADSGSPGWALVNYGTPSARIENGQVLMSLLRSPAFGHCLERYGQNYPMPTGNIRDSGWHHFTFSLLPHGGAGDMPELSRRASALNARPFSLANGSASPPDAAWPKLISENITLEAVKPVFLPAPNGIPDNAVVLRLLNLSDQPGMATLRQDAELDVVIHECNLIEEPVGEAFELKKGRSKTLDFKPFKFRSFIVWPKHGGK